MHLNANLMAPGLLVHLPEWWLLRKAETLPGVSGCRARSLEGLSKSGFEPGGSGRPDDPYALKIYWRILWKCIAVLASPLPKLAATKKGDGSTVTAPAG